MYVLLNKHLERCLHLSLLNNIYVFFSEPINTFHSSYKTDNEPIRLSYHNNVHYNSVIDPYKQTIGLGLGLPVANFQPGVRIFSEFVISAFSIERYGCSKKGHVGSLDIYLLAFDF